ncbi:hypothetical protein SETIT_3G319300v2 [Setaria italica]|uniref:Uncharacterized protein n=1 Tax=Setaria italica TaxID=4555 RepID=A0A368QL62_SETIT|nr:hypothetical protein SETIT_3G319300v2 [Setaria italica]
MGRSNPWFDRIPNEPTRAHLPRDSPTAFLKAVVVVWREAMYLDVGSFTSGGNKGIFHEDLHSPKAPSPLYKGPPSPFSNTQHKKKEKRRGTLPLSLLLWYRIGSV